MINRDIKQRRGSRSDLEFEFAGDLTGCGLSFVVKKSLDITDWRLIDKNTIRAGEIETAFNAESGRTTAIIHLIEEDTYSLPAGNYYYDLDNIQEGITLAAGVFILSADVQTPFDNLEILPSNLPRAVIILPSELEDNSILHKTREEGIEKITGLTIPAAMESLGINQLAVSKVDKVEGKELSECDLTSELKGNYDAAFNEKHTHLNRNNLDSINQNLGSGNSPQFSQIGVGRSVYGSWSLSLQTGITTRSGTYIDWEGGNARLRENGYNLEFSNFDGTSLVTTFKTGAGGNISYRPLITNGMAYKVTNVSASYVLTAADTVTLVTASSTDKTITLPSAGIAEGTLFFVKKADSGSGKVIIQPAAGTIDGGAAVEITAQYGVFQFVKTSAGYSILSRNI